MKNTTKSLHTRVDVSNAYPAATPIYQNSAFEAQSDFFYSRKNNPNVQELEEAVGHMEGSKFGIATTTGMSAINLVLSLLKPNQTIVINKLIYGCTFKYFEWFSENYNCNFDLMHKYKQTKSIIDKMVSNTFLDIGTYIFPALL